MAFLKRQTKAILLQLAEEFDVQADESMKVLKIVDAIIESECYEEDTAKLLLDRIKEEFEEQKLELERVKQKEEERLELAKTREFELAKMQLQSGSDAVSVTSNSSIADTASKRANLRDLVPKYDPKQLDISLFLMIFERQAMREKIKDQDLVSHLIPLLPLEAAEQILKEPDDKAYDFAHIKQMLFKRFKLSAGAFRKKFETHNKKPDSLWSDLVYELKSYLTNWLELVEVNDFESLKELILVEQLKKRIPIEIKEHYVDSWEEFGDAKILAENATSTKRSGKKGKTLIRARRVEILSERIGKRIRAPKIRSPPWWIRIVMACLRTTLRSGSQTVGNSPPALL